MSILLALPCAKRNVSPHNSAAYRYISDQRIRPGREGAWETKPIIPEISKSYQAFGLTNGRMGSSTLPSVRQKMMSKKHSLFVSEVHGGMTSSLLAARQLYGDLAVGAVIGQSHLGGYGGITGPRKEEEHTISADGFSSVTWSAKCPSSQDERSKGTRRRTRKRCRRSPEVYEHEAPSSTIVQCTNETDRSIKRPSTKHACKASPTSSVFNRHGGHKKLGPLARVELADHQSSSAPRSFAKEARCAERDHVSSKMARIPISYNDAQTVFRESDSDSHTLDGSRTTSSLATEDEPGIRTKMNGGKSQRRTLQHHACKKCSLLNSPKTHKVCKPQRSMFCIMQDFWSMSPQARRRQMRYVVMTERTGASRALDVFAARIGGQTKRACDLLKLVRFAKASQSKKSIERNV